MFDKACALIQEHVRDELNAMQADDFLAGADFRQVWTYMPIYTKEHYKLREEQGFIPNDSQIPRSMKVSTTRSCFAFVGCAIVFE